MALASILGIDFGQEFTKAVLVAPGLPFEVVLTPDSKRKEASVLGFKRAHGSNDTERLYGSDAVTFASRSPKEVLLYSKPLLGLPFDDQNPSVQEYTQRFPGLQLTPSKNSRSTIAMNVFGDSYPLEELLAMNFDSIKSRATAMLADNIKSQTDTIKNVAITVPPHFTSSQRRAISDAVEIAGLKLISVIDDGTAVAVNYASQRQFSDEKEYHIIYDMGAGSTDATLVSFRQANVAEGKFTKNVLFIEIEGIGYEETLGGHQLTQSIVTLLRSKFLQKNPKIVEADLLADQRASRKLWREADRVKTILSANTETTSSIESFYKEIDFRATVSREEFEAVVADLKPLVTSVIQNALSNPLNPEIRKQFSIDQVSSVIFTGGSTRVPFVQKEIIALVGEDKIAKNVNADEAAVMGTTLR
ncbi:actin-like ATPase domain-containing protein, partial [Nadsonia fulvescens var. elongata DSM 6958]